MKNICLRSHEIKTIFSREPVHILRPCKPAPFLSEDGGWFLPSKKVNIGCNRDGLIGLLEEKSSMIPGDEFWVKETWGKTSVAYDLNSIESPWTVYKVADNRTDFGGPWNSPVSMKIEDTRVFLKLVDLTVDQVQELPERFIDSDKVKENWDIYNKNDFAWDKNPWAYAYTFMIVNFNT